jgi:protoporphyrinogen oxidase
VEFEVRRLAHAYPVYRVGYERHHERLDGWATSLERVVTFGRQGLFVHDNSHHAYAMAWAAADAVRDDGSFDRRAWTEARRRFAAHVVED